MEEYGAIHQVGVVEVLQHHKTTWEGAKKWEQACAREIYAAKSANSGKEAKINKSTCQPRRVVDGKNSDLEKETLAHCERQWKVEPVGAFDLHLKHKAVHDVLVPVVQVPKLVPLQVLKGENTPENWQFIVTLWSLLQVIVWSCIIQSLDFFGKKLIPIHDLYS